MVSMPKWALDVSFYFLYFTADFANIDEPELMELTKISHLSSPTFIIDFNVFSDSSRSSSTSSTLINAAFPPISPHDLSLSLAISSTSTFQSFSPTLVLPQPAGLSLPPVLPTTIDIVDDAILERISEEIQIDAISQYFRQLEEEEEEDDEKHNEDCKVQPQRSLKGKREGEGEGGWMCEGEGVGVRVGVGGWVGEGEGGWGGLG